MKLKQFPSILVLLLIFFWIGSANHLLRAESIEGPIQKIRAPNSEWELKKKSKKDGTEVKLAVKGKEPVVNIGVTVTKNVPIASNTYLEEVRKQMLTDPRYKESNMEEVHAKERFGKTWAFLAVVLGPEIHQELWVRKLDGDVVLMVLYTAVGSYYERYHPDFDGVLEQAALP